MKSKWFVSSNPVAGVMMYQAQRKKDENAVDSSENRETSGKWYTDKEEAQAIADKLNAAEQIKGAGKEPPHEEVSNMAAQEEKKQPEKKEPEEKQPKKKTAQEMVKEASKAFSV